MSIQTTDDGVGHVLDAVDLIADVESRDQDALLQAALNDDGQIREVAERVSDDVGEEPRDVLLEALSRVRDRERGDAR